MKRIRWKARRFNYERIDITPNGTSIEVPANQMDFDGNVEGAKIWNWNNGILVTYNNHEDPNFLQVTELGFTALNEIIKSGELIKIKEYYDKFKNQKNKSKSKKLQKIYNSLISYSFQEIQDNFDFKTISKEKEGENINPFSKGRIQFKLTDDKFSKTDTVEKFALKYYSNKENMKGIIGENYVIKAIYFLLLWEEIFDDEIPLVFQSKYQECPLDFFEKDFYINRKEKLDKKLEKINKYKKEELINHIKNIYRSKKGIKNPCICWDNYLNNENVLIKVSIAFGPQKLVQIFRIILNQGFKYVKKGMPDLFLWKENICSKYKN